MKLRYLRGGQDSYETVEFDVIKDGGSVYITTCVINVRLLLAGVKTFPCGNGNDIKLSPEQQLKVLEFLQAERKKITDSFPVKTYEGWHKSGLPTFEDYCKPGDNVDNEMVDYFVNSVPPITLQSTCTQAGEAYSSEQDDDGVYRNTYTTFHCIGNGRWKYDGLCFKGSNENRVKKTYSQLKIEQIMCEAKRKADSNV